MQLVPYINFAGTASEALKLYTKAFGGKVEEVHLYSEMKSYARSFLLNGTLKLCMLPLKRLI